MYLVSQAASCITCKGSEILLKEKWISIRFHIQNIHVFHGHHMYTECGHKILPEHRNKQWIYPTNEAFDALQRTVYIWFAFRI